MMKSWFLRIVKSPAHGLDKETALRESIKAVRGSAPHSLAHEATNRDFVCFDDFTFGYWLSPDVRRQLVALRPLEPAHAEVRRGGCTANDARWLRLWFEVPPRRVGLRDGYVAFAKGGDFAPFYSDVPLVVAWDAERRTFRDFYGRKGRWTSRPEALEYYFRPGLTYPRKSYRISVRALPAGCAFGDKGPSVFVSNDSEDRLFGLLGVLNSNMFEYLDWLRSPRADAKGLPKAHEVGAVQRVSIPEEIPEQLVRIASEMVALHRRAAQFDETTHDFTIPLLAQKRSSLSEAWAHETEERRNHASRVDVLRVCLDDAVFDAYGISPQDRKVIREDIATSSFGTAATGVVPREDIAAEAVGNDDDEEDDEATSTEAVEARRYGDTLEDAAAALLSYALGCAFARWDVRIGSDPSRAPALSGPFEPLPRCSPGMLVGPDGFPAAEPPQDYPIDVAWDGILVDERGSARDLVGRVHDVFVALYGDAADARLNEALGLVGNPKDGLRSYFRDVFFERVHRPMYTMGGHPPRRAPIYWPLYPRIGNRLAPWGLWLYFHRMTRDTLFSALRIVRDKREREEQALRKMEGAIAEVTTKKSSRAQQNAIEETGALVDALRVFEKEMERVAGLGVVPDFDDGVVLNCAVLHHLMKWKDAEHAWRALEAGKYDWSNIARKIRPKEAEAFQMKERSWWQGALLDVDAGGTTQSKPARRGGKRK